MSSIQRQNSAPRVAILTDRAFARGGSACGPIRVTGGERWMYAEAVREAGGDPIWVTDNHRTPEELLKDMDALVIPGGPDLNPRLYGQEPNPAAFLRRASVEYDAWQKEMLEAALKMKLPVLGICRGMQLLNVVHGGTLYQDILIDRGEPYPGKVDHIKADHAINFAPDSEVAKIFGKEALGVNSSHHQAIRDLGPGLVATARSEDDLIEAVEKPGDPTVLGVQFHPERFSDKYRVPFFEHFVQHAKQFQSMRPTVSPAPEPPAEKPVSAGAPGAPTSAADPGPAASERPAAPQRPPAAPVAARRPAATAAAPTVAGRAPSVSSRSRGAGAPATEAPASERPRTRVETRPAARPTPPKFLAQSYAAQRRASYRVALFAAAGCAALVAGAALWAGGAFQGNGDPAVTSIEVTQAPIASGVQSPTIATPGFPSIPRTPVTARQLTTLYGVVQSHADDTEAVRQLRGDVAANLKIATDSANVYATEYAALTAAAAPLVSYEKRLDGTYQAGAQSITVDTVIGEVDVTATSANGTVELIKRDNGSVSVYRTDAQGEKTRLYMNEARDFLSIDDAGAERTLLLDKDGTVRGFQTQAPNAPEIQLGLKSAELTVSGYTGDHTWVYDNYEAQSGSGWPSLGSDKALEHFHSVTTGPEDHEVKTIVTSNLFMDGHLETSAPQTTD